MDVESSFPSSSLIDETKSTEGSSLHRRDRASIAAQACDTCRIRKSKCNELRPRCGRCKRLDVDCHYSGYQAQKKNESVSQVLDSLRRIESKLDNLGAHGQIQKTQQSPSLGSAFSVVDNPLCKNPPSSLEGSGGFRRPPAYPTNELKRSYGHLCAAHKIILWPAIYSLIVNKRPQAIEEIHHVFKEGRPWSNHLELLKLPDDFDRHSYSATPLLACSGRPHPLESRSSFNGLTTHDVRRLTCAYFYTFNVLVPILDREEFEQIYLASMLRDGLNDNDAQACIVFLVLALGQVAIDAVHGPSISIIDGIPSGFRGGSKSNPPGLGLFNEARRLVGFVMHQLSLDNVRIYILIAAYSETCARHLDFYRSSVTASVACQALIRCELVDWTSPKSEYVKRAYWSCMLNENVFLLESDLPGTGIGDLEDTVPLPFSDPPGPQSNARNSPNNPYQYQYHFLAMIALRRLTNRIHHCLHNIGDEQSTSELTEDYGGPPTLVIQELGRQLDSWRSFLPESIQWSDDDSLGAPVSTSSEGPDDTIFASSQQPGEIVDDSYSLDILNGQLRTRFYNAKFMLYRPFIFKALHFPDTMQEGDAACCAIAMDSACLWPLSLSPQKDKKRLIPHLFTWTKKFVGILLILRMTTENECLRRICNQFEVSTLRMEQTAVLLLEWVRDLKQLDSVVEWSWEILRALYQKPHA